MLVYWWFWNVDDVLRTLSCYNIYRITVFGASCIHILNHKLTYSIIWLNGICVFTYISFINIEIKWCKCRNPFNNKYKWSVFSKSFIAIGLFSNTIDNYIVTMYTLISECGSFKGQFYRLTEFYFLQILVNLCAS